MEKRLLILRMGIVTISLWNNFGIGFEQSESCCWLDLGFIMVSWWRGGKQEKIGE